VNPQLDELLRQAGVSDQTIVQNHVLVTRAFWWVYLFWFVMIVLGSVIFYYHMKWIHSIHRTNLRIVELLESKAKPRSVESDQRNPSAVIDKPGEVADWKYQPRPKNVV
jgi:ABC-type transport system involved in Fe-S cluster assembly fused permease/ATPase subunit